MPKVASAKRAPTPSGRTRSAASRVARAAHSTETTATARFQGSGSSAIEVATPTAPTALATAMEVVRPRPDHAGLRARRAWTRTTAASRASALVKR